MFYLIIPAKLPEANLLDSGNGNPPMNDIIFS